MKVRSPAELLILSIPAPHRRERFPRIVADPILENDRDVFDIRDARRRSAGNYVRMHNAGQVYLMRTTMDRVAHRLAGCETFIRVRRPAIINVRAVAALERYGKAAFVVQLRSGARIISSRYYQRALRRLLRPDG